MRERLIGSQIVVLKVIIRKVHNSSLPSKISSSECKVLVTDMLLSGLSLEKYCISTSMGFEPMRTEHIGLAVQRLNHSATSSDCV